MMAGSVWFLFLCACSIFACKGASIRLASRGHKSTRTDRGTALAGVLCDCVGKAVPETRRSTTVRKRPFGNAKALNIQHKLFFEQRACHIAKQ